MRSSPAHHTTVGALNIYSRLDLAFDPADRQDGLAIAAQVAIAVAAAQEIEDLTAALDSRTVVSQAVGMIMQRYDLRPDAAFAVLVKVASDTETKLRDVALELSKTGRLHGHDMAR